mgnify:CR=1 FL=1
MNEGFQRVAAANQVREGDFLAVTLEDGREVVLMKAQGQIYCTDIMCTHQEAWLDSGFVHTNTLEVECPLHEGRFDLRTGAATHEPATEPVRTYEVRVEGNDVFVKA